MTVKETEIQDCFLIQPQIFGDERGYFFESYNQEKFNQETGLNVRFVQDNQSFSTYGVIRGLHIQMGEFAQAKLVRVVHGKVLDVAVDARKDSPTFGKIVCAELSAEINRNYSFLEDVYTDFQYCLKMQFFNINATIIIIKNQNLAYFLTTQL